MDRTQIVSHSPLVDRLPSIDPREQKPDLEPAQPSFLRQRLFEVLPEDPYRLLVENIRDYALCLLAPSGEILTWNSGAVAILGYQAQEIIGRPFSCSFSAEDRAANTPERLLQEAAQKGRLEKEGWRVRPDGSRFWARSILTVIRDQHGRICSFAEVIRDRTEPRLAEMLMHSIADHTIDGIITIDEQSHIQSFNRAAEKIFGYSSSQVVGKKLNFLIPALGPNPLDSFLDRCPLSGETRAGGSRRELEGRRQDGTLFPVEMTITDLELEVDERRYFSSVVRDLTERKALEAQLRQSQKMEAFGQLAGGVAHDFNNLLTVISGYSELLLAHLPAGDSLHSLIKPVQNAAERAGALTRQLLAFSRQQVLEPRVLNLNALVRDIEAMLSRLIGEDVALASSLAPDLSPVRVDPDQIGQVLLNLAINARDAMPHGGKLIIETRNVKLDETYTKTHPEVPPGDYVLLALTDNGSGMPKEIQSRIFEPFFTTKGVGRGTGLGLAVVHGIVKQSGGSVEVYSELGTGTTFKVYLPAVQEARWPATSVDRGPVPLGNETILLVEDEDAVRELASLALQNYGYTVLEATCGKEALQLLETSSRRIDLLVTDVIMPEMSGRQLADLLRARYPHTEVLFLSGYTNDAVVRHGILHQDVAFLQKPFTPASLANKVRAVLDKR